MERYHVFVDYQKTSKQGGSTANMHDSFYLDTRSEQLVKSKIEAKYPTDRIVITNIRWQ